MFSQQVITSLITVSIAVLGWIVAHYFSSRRDRALKRREIITTHLINAYRILANDITHRPQTADRNLKLETVVAKLQLFGSDNQIKLGKTLAENVVKGGTFYVDDVLNDLRTDLRKELQLSKAMENVKWLRFNKEK